MKFDHFVLIRWEVEWSLPTEIFCHYRCDTQADFNTLILDVTGIHIVIFISCTSRRRQSKQLVLRVCLIVSEIEVQTVIEEFPFRTYFPWSTHFRFQFIERSFWIRLDSSASHDQVVASGNRITDEKRQVITYFTPWTSYLTEVDPFRHRQRVIDDPWQANRRIEETAVFCISQRRRPVVTGGQVQV